jgi:hypothetical protein
MILHPQEGRCRDLGAEPFGQQGGVLRTNAEDREVASVAEDPLRYVPGMIVDLRDGLSGENDQTPIFPCLLKGLSKDTDRYVSLELVQDHARQSTLDRGQPGPFHCCSKDAYRDDAAEDARVASARIIHGDGLGRRHRRL